MPILPLRLQARLVLNCQYDFTDVFCLKLDISGMLRGQADLTPV
ncbi:MAG: hypothetical protein WED11_02420 [Natronospirillum sp.]